MKQQYKSGDWVLVYNVTKSEPTRCRLYDSKPGFDGGMMVYAYHPWFPEGHEWGMIYTDQTPIKRKMTTFEIKSLPTEVVTESSMLCGSVIDYTKDLVSV